MNLDYNSNIEQRLKGRYITLEDLLPIFEDYKKSYDISVIGKSENNQDIHAIKFGSGKFKVLMWSQMHGNESTTTKAIFDLLLFLTSEGDLAKKILANCSLFIIPMLNPDGAKAYTRENSNGIDLNRDALNQTQAESKVLRNAFESFKPDLCLNMHDQRTIFSVGDTQKPATISFLAPAADIEKSITTGRREAMCYISAMKTRLEREIPGQIGRFDDTFNQNCVGDYFQSRGIPTILFEAGHFPEDYEREISRKYIFKALVYLFEYLCADEKGISYEEYDKIPENNKNARDIVIFNARLDDDDKNYSIGIQFVEILKEGKIQFNPQIDIITQNAALFGHKEIDACGNFVKNIDNSNIENGQFTREIVINEKKVPLI